MCKHRSKGLDDHPWMHVSMLNSSFHVDLALSPGLQPLIINYTDVHSISMQLCYALSPTQSWLMWQYIFKLFTTENKHRSRENSMKDVCTHSPVSTIFNSWPIFSHLYSHILLSHSMNNYEENFNHHIISFTDISVCISQRTLKNNIFITPKYSSWFLNNSKYSVNESSSC